MVCLCELHPVKRVDLSELILCRFDGKESSGWYIAVVGQLTK